MISHKDCLIPLLFSRVMTEMGRPILPRPHRIDPKIDVANRCIVHRLVFDTFIGLVEHYPSLLSIIS